jgi:MFS transporter, ACDE family, multidrug resistance protein
VAAGRAAPEVTEAAVELARLLDAPIEVLHVLETDVIGDQAVDVESSEAARAVIADSVAALSSAGVPGNGHIVRLIGDHGDSGRRIASFAAERHARMIVIGTPADGGSAELFDASLTAQLIRHARCEVHLVPIMPDRHLAAADTGRS